MHCAQVPHRSLPPGAFGLARNHVDASFPFGNPMQLALHSDGPALAPISPRRELGAYEALWLEQGAPFKTLAEKFAKDPMALPSDMVPRAQADACADKVFEIFAKAGVNSFGVRINHAGDYPKKLRDARYPV